MSSKTKIIVLKLKDLLFYATVAILAIIVLLLLYILFQPETTMTNSTISVRVEQDCAMHNLCTHTLTEFPDTKIEAAI